MTEVRRWLVPGRVNLIGEHLDYNGGPVLPMAIDRHVTIKARLRDDADLHAWSALGPKTVIGPDVAPGDVSGWATVVAGAAWALRTAGHRVPGADLVIESDLPAGAGLASSAATACGTVRALADLAGVELDQATVAAVARRAETDFVGVPVGIMDQLSVLHGDIQLIDTRSGDVSPVTVDWHGLSLVVIDTGVTHRVAAGEYAVRRSECAQAAEVLGLEHLAAAGPDAVLRFDEDDPLKRRVRHVVTETTRVRGAVRAAAEADWKRFGGLLTSSHESLRDDFEVSCGELDVAVTAALEAGALGARMTGAGFGGSAIALAPTDQLLGLREKIVSAFTDHSWPSPTLFTVRPTKGAHLAH